MNNELITVENEVWKDIKDFIGIYQVSNLGRVKSLDRVIETSVNTFFVKGKILSPKVTKSGHLSVALSRNCYSKHRSVHRLVALHFISNPDNYDTIHHKNHIPSDNRKDNLEWCSASKNQFYKWKKNNFDNIRGMSVEKYISLNKAHITKIKSEEVTEMRKLYITGKYSQREIAEIFSVKEEAARIVLCK